MKVAPLCLFVLLLVPSAAAQDEALSQAAYCDSVQAYFDSFHDGDVELCCPVEEMPELIGGFDALLARVVYPDSAREAGIEGRVIVKFVVDATGGVRCLKVARGLGYGLDEAALSAVETLRFKPGKARGRAIDAIMLLPVPFPPPDSSGAPRQ